MKTILILFMISTPAMAYIEFKKALGIECIECHDSIKPFSFDNSKKNILYRTAKYMSNQIKTNTGKFKDKSCYDCHGGG